MFCITNRVKDVYVRCNEDKRLGYNSDNTTKRGIMGLRIGRIKQGFVIYCNRIYTIIPWSKIDSITILL
jgi:hypothetical protein